MVTERSTKTARAALRKAVNGAASTVRGVATLFAVVLAAQITLTLGNANPQNSIFMRVADLARPLALGFADLFTPADPKAQVLVNYGLAALFWLGLGVVLARVIRRLG